MKAEDTVMNGKGWEAINQKAGVDVLDIVINLDGRYTPNQQAELIVERCNLVAQTQAEISFKAGKDSLLMELNSPSNLIQAARQEGIREVVRWIDSQVDFEDVEASLYCVLHKKVWQDQKKKWGIEVTI